MSQSNRIALVTTSWLDDEERYKKTQKFVDYYSRNTDWDIWVLDNNSHQNTVKKFEAWMPMHTRVHSFDKHYGRPTHLDYRYLWRAVYHLKNFFPDYDKVVYMDNDFYVLTRRMFDYIKYNDEEWVTFWCPQYTMPETGCHVITSGSKTYNDFVASGNYVEHNGKIMEITLPVTYVAKTFKGDRYPEFEPQRIVTNEDFWAQCRLEDRFD